MWSSVSIVAGWMIHHGEPFLGVTTGIINYQKPKCYYYASLCVALTHRNWSQTKMVWKLWTAFCATSHRYVGYHNALLQSDPSLSPFWNCIQFLEQRSEPRPFTTPIQSLLAFLCRCLEHDRIIVWSLFVLQIILLLLCWVFSSQSNKMLWFVAIVIRLISNSKYIVGTFTHLTMLFWHWNATLELTFIHT